MKKRNKFLSLLLMGFMVSESIMPISAQSQTYPSNTDAELVKDHSNAHYGGEGSASSSVKNDVCYGSSSLSGIDEMTFRKITPDHNSGDSVEVICAQSNGYYAKGYGMSASDINNYHWTAWYKKRENDEIDKNLKNGNYRGFNKSYVERLRPYESQIRRINDGKFPELRDYRYPADTATGKLDFWVHKPGYYDLYGNPRYSSITLDAYQEFTYTVEIGTHHVGCSYNGSASVDSGQHKKDGEKKDPPKQENWGYCGWASCVRADGTTCSTGGIPGNASSPDAACGPKPSTNTSTPNPNNSSSAYRPGASVYQASGRLNLPTGSLSSKKSGGSKTSKGGTSGRDNPSRIDKDRGNGRPSSGASKKTSSSGEEERSCTPYDYWTYEYFTETKAVKVASTNIVNNMYASDIKNLGYYSLVLNGDPSGHGYSWENQDYGFISYNPYNHLEIKDKWFTNMASNYICIPNADDTCEPGTETTEPVPENPGSDPGDHGGGDSGSGGNEPVDIPDPDGNDDGGLPPSVIIEIDIAEDNPQKKGDYDKFVHLNENVKKRKNYE